MKQITFWGLLSIGFWLGYAPVATAQSPSTSIIDQAFIDNLRNYLKSDIVILSVLNQNTTYADLTEEEVIELDKQWREEHKKKEKPLISATLSNPLSSYLTRIQAHSIGLYTEIFVIDNKGLNAGQSNITSDFWQGDEAKWQKTFKISPNAIFIDDPEWDKESRTWRSQVNLSIPSPDGSEAIGSATFEINLTELTRRNEQ